MESKDLIIRYIETTGRCNMDCPICIRRMRNFDMSVSDLISIIEANYNILNGQRTWLDFSGEPLVDASFFEKVKLLKDAGVIPMISTNGLLLDEENCRKLAVSGIDYLVVSVSTLNRELYYKTRGTDALETVLANIERLKHITERSDSRMQIQAVAIDTGDLDEKSFIAYFHSHGIHAAVHNYTNRSMNSRLLFNVGHEIPERGRCTGLSQNICILCNLDVVACCCDFAGDNVLGNLRNYGYSVEKLMGNGKLEELFNKLDRHIYEGACKNCGDWIYHQPSSAEEYVKVYPLPGSNLK